MRLIVVHTFYEGNEAGERGAKALKKMIEDMAKREGGSVMVEITEMNVPDQFLTQDAEGGKNN